MSDIIKISKGAKIKATTSVSKRRVNLADANTVTSSMLRDGIVTDSKMSNAGLNSVKLIDSGNSNRVLLQSDSTPDMTADRALLVDSENLAATLRLQGLGQVLPNSSYLISSDFPSTSGLYAWHINALSDGATISNWTGGIDLTRNGNLTQQADHLGNSVYCEFDGTNDYLSSANAAFSSTTTYSFACWAYRSDWSTGHPGNGTIAARNDGSNGWLLQVYSTGILGYWTAVGGVPNVIEICSTLGLTPGWHHIAMVRDNTGGTHQYIDGKRVGAKASVAMAAGGSLEIGSTNGGSQKFNGRIAEFAYCTNIWTEAQVRQIYSRGSRRFAFASTASTSSHNQIQIPSNETIDYPERNLIFTSVPAGWTASMAVGLPYRDVMGNWRFRFNFSGTATSTAGPVYWSIAGVTWKFGSADRIALAGTSNQFPGGTSAHLGTAQITMYLSGSYTVFSVSGDVPLLNQPTL